MIFTSQDVCRPRFLEDNWEGATAADVVESVKGTGAVTGDQERIVSNGVGDIVARSGKSRLMSGKEPALRKDGAALERIDLKRGVPRGRDCVMSCFIGG